MMFALLLCIYTSWIEQTLGRGFRISVHDDGWSNQSFSRNNYIFNPSSKEPVTSNHTGSAQLNYSLMTHEPLSETVKEGVVAFVEPEVDNVISTSQSFQRFSAMHARTKKQTLKNNKHRNQEENPLLTASMNPKDLSSQSFTYLSDPQNPGVRWCWKLLHPITTEYNVGYLVMYKKCLDHRLSLYYKETQYKTVCTKAGGLLIYYNHFDKSSVPYKITCISRDDARRTPLESCWELETTEPHLVLKHVIPSQVLFSKPNKRLDLDSPCHIKNLPWPFYEGKHISSTFDVLHGGIPRLYMCNYVHVEYAQATYLQDASGCIIGFGPAFCYPPLPRPHLACSNLASQCFPYYAPTRNE